jgi:hypothetical protein
MKLKGRQSVRGFRERKNNWEKSGLQFLRQRGIEARERCKRTTCSSNRYGQDRYRDDEVHHGDHHCPAHPARQVRVIGFQCLSPCRGAANSASQKLQE